MKWEYRCVTFQHGRAPENHGWNVGGKVVGALKDLSAEEMLNALGKDGWELVSVMPDNTYPDREFYLKRAI